MEVDSVKYNCNNDNIELERSCKSGYMLHHQRKEEEEREKVEVKEEKEKKKKKKKMMMRS